MCWCAVLTVLCAATTAPVPVEPPPLRHFTCHPASSPVVVDGKADEQAWTSAESITDFRLAETFEAPVTNTSVQICYDREYLYAFFVCEDADLFVLYDKRDDNIWESDCVELFLKPLETNPIYYEFEVAPNNAVFDARMVNTGSGGFQRWAKTWDCTMKTAVTANGTLGEWHDRDEGYTAEIAIPLKAFDETIGERPLDGQTWKFAAIRVDLSVTLEKAQRSATANIPDGDMHRKDGYFTLTFSPEK